MNALENSLNLIETEENENSEEEQKVIQNSDEIYKQDVEWVQDIPYTEPNEYEKNIIHKKTLQEIEVEEEEEIKNKTQEQLDKEYKQAYILRVKVIAMHNMGKSIIANPSYWKHEHKKKLIDEMQYILDNMVEEEIIEKFNFIVNENLLDTNFKYETFPLKRT